jgi:hypothetical protein
MTPSLFSADEIHRIRDDVAAKNAVGFGDENALVSFTEDFARALEARLLAKLSERAGRMPEPGAETNGDVFGHANEDAYTAEQMRAEKISSFAAGWLAKAGPVRAYQICAYGNTRHLCVRDDVADEYASRLRQSSGTDADVTVTALYAPPMPR